MSENPSRGSRGNTQRGARKPSAKSSGMPKKEIKKYVNDYNYYLGSAKQASDYETTTEFLINYIKKTFDYGSDIGQALKELKEVDINPWKPTLNQSSDTDAAIEAIQNKQFEMEFKADYDSYRKRVLALENNKMKVYALFWERCTKGMKNKLNHVLTSILWKMTQLSF
jgi:hypothetical protein